MSNWIDNYQLFLFDFDGLLVNTEELHYLAYKKMLAAHGYDFNWDFNRYCQCAHYEPQALKEALYVEFPKLDEDWAALYKEKQQQILNLVEQGAVHLMPGVEEFLTLLQSNNKTSSIVTHSPLKLINAIRDQHPILKSITHIVTREDYSKPKPDPECYQTAIARYLKPDDKVIGFEDTPRGLRALMGTQAKPILVCEAEYPEIPAFIKAGALHFKSFKEVLRSDLSS